MKGLAIIAITISAFLLSPVPLSYSEEALSLKEVQSIICQPQYSWDCSQMVRIAFRESNFYPSATNYDCYPNHINPATNKPYICVGLLQVMEFHVPDWSLLKDPYYNVEVSYRLWLDKGGKPWGQ